MNDGLDDYVRLQRDVGRISYDLGIVKSRTKAIRKLVLQTSVLLVGLFEEKYSDSPIPKTERRILDRLKAFLEHGWEYIDE